MADGFSGGCLCGSVRYESTMGAAFAGDCYCDDCRKASGTSHGSHMGVPEAAFTLTGALSSFEKPADSGNVVTRKFCPTCGSPVLSSNSGVPGMVFVRASSLDDAEAFKPMMTVYGSRAPSWSPPRHEPVFPDMPPPSDRPDGAPAD